MYSELFSRIYNSFGWNYYPEAFAGSLLKWIGQKNLSVKSLLDLGCGTGVLCRMMRQHGIDTCGIDLSEPMIRIAREEDPDGAYETADMTEYQPMRSFDLVTCTGDAINHLESLSDIEKTFRNVYACLSDGGYLIFDLLNESEISDEEPIDFDFSDAVRARFMMRKTGERSVDLTISVREDGNETVHEVITEKVYDVNEIMELLHRVGFRDTEVSHNLAEGEGKALTWFVTACKA